jgi:hypothetical protein
MVRDMKQYQKSITGIWSEGLRRHSHLVDAFWIVITSVGTYKEYRNLEYIVDQLSNTTLDEFFGTFRASNPGALPSYCRGLLMCNIELCTWNCKDTTLRQNNLYFAAIDKKIETILKRSPRLLKDCLLTRTTENDPQAEERRGLGATAIEA